MTFPERIFQWKSAAPFCYNLSHIASTQPHTSILSVQSNYFKSALFIVGSYDRYDGMIYPEVPPKSLRERVEDFIGVTAIKSYFRTTSENRSVTRPNRETIVKNSLNIHLDNHPIIFDESGVLHICKNNILSAMNSICEVYHQLQYCSLCNDGRPRNDWIIDIFKVSQDYQYNYE